MTYVPHARGSWRGWSELILVFIFDRRADMCDKKYIHKFRPLSKDYPFLVKDTTRNMRIISHWYFLALVYIVIFSINIAPTSSDWFVASIWRRWSELNIATAIVFVVVVSGHGSAPANSSNRKKAQQTFTFKNGINSCVHKQTFWFWWVNVFNAVLCKLTFW